MSETKPAWFVPCLGVTVLVYLQGLLLLPYSGIGIDMPIVGIGSFALSLLVGIGVVATLVAARQLRLAGEQDVPAALKQLVIAKRHQIGWIAIGLVVYSFLATGYNWVKVQLDFVFPFWADELFANMDASLFGTDPYLLTNAALGPGIYLIDFIYSLWFPGIVLTLAYTFWRRDDVAVTAYFILWGICGTAMQAALSSAGPIFWSRMGYGERFDALYPMIPSGTQAISDYLWRIYESGGHELGGGISAMPSLHVGMAAWIALTFSASRWRWYALAYLGVVWVGSVALGWHYFVDGLGGLAGAIVAFWLARLLIPAKKRGDAAPDMVPQPA